MTDAVLTKSKDAVLDALATATSALGVSGKPASLVGARRTDNTGEARRRARVKAHDRLPDLPTPASLALASPSSETH